MRKPVVGYEGIYEIEEDGTVWAFPNQWNGYRTTPLRSGMSSGRYVKICLRKNNIDRSCSLHRLVALTFIPNPENKPCVNHIDGDRSNNHVSNLEWCTHLENTRHAHRIGIVPKQRKGSASPRSKLTEEQAQAIKKDTRLLRIISKEYSVSEATISMLRNGKTYSYLA